MHSRRLLRLAIPLSLAILAPLAFQSCSFSRAITPNAHSESVGPEQVKADRAECTEYGATERRRLLEELVTGDPSIVASKQMGEKGRAIGEVVGTAKGVGGAVGGAVGEFLFSDWNPDNDDEEVLANYLGIDGGTDIISAQWRIRDICLRGKGYEVARDAKDGAGKVELRWDPARAVILGDDGTERIFYQYLAPSVKKKMEEEAVNDSAGE